MKENMISIGLDIGTTKIVAMIGQTNEYNKMKECAINLLTEFNYTWN